MRTRLGRQPGDDLAYVEVRVSLLPSNQGGRRKALVSGFRCGIDWGQGFTTEGLMIVNDAQLEVVDQVLLEPGDAANARLYPFRPELWTARQAGVVVTLREGTRAVGEAVVTRWVDKAQ